MKTKKRRIGYSILTPNPSPRLELQSLTITFYKGMTFKKESKDRLWSIPIHLTDWELQSWEGWMDQLLQPPSCTDKETDRGPWGPGWPGCARHQSSQFWTMPPCASRDIGPGHQQAFPVAWAPRTECYTFHQRLKLDPQNHRGTTYPKGPIAKITRELSKRGSHPGPEKNVRRHKDHDALSVWGMPSQGTEATLQRFMIWGWPFKI